MVSQRPGRAGRRLPGTALLAAVAVLLPWHDMITENEAERLDEITRRLGTHLTTTQPKKEHK
jgi:hypothetical protein